MGNNFPGTKPLENYPFWKLTDTPRLCIFLFLHLDMLLASRLWLRNKSPTSQNPPHPSGLFCLWYTAHPYDLFWLTKWSKLNYVQNLELRVYDRFSWKKLVIMKSPLKCFLKKWNRKGQKGAAQLVEYFLCVYKALGSISEQHKLGTVVPISNLITCKISSSVSSLTS